MDVTLYDTTLRDGEQSPGASMNIEEKLLLAHQLERLQVDVIEADVARVELGDCLRFQLTGAGARDLYRLTASHQGRRLVVFINGAAVGARRIDGPFADGAIMIFVELDDAALPALVETVKKSSAKLQKELARRG